MQIQKLYLRVYFSRIVAGVVAMVVINLLYIMYSTTNVSAYSASVTTDNTTTLDVAAGGDGTGIVEKSINVVSDCRSGYNLVVSTTQNSDLYADGVNTGTAAFTAVDGASALNNSNNTNKWGYTLTTNPTGGTVFSPLSTTAATLKTPAQTASPSSDINDTFSIYYGAKVDGDVAPGSYSMANNGVIVYQLTMDTTCAQYTVSFNPNGGTVAAGGSNPTQDIQAGEPTRLAPSDSLKAPQGASYTDANNNTINGQADKLWTFWGWNTKADGTGDWYKDRELVDDLGNAGPTITLYAQWKQATLADMIPGTQVGTEKVIDHNEMLDMRPEVCYNSPITTAANAPAATLLDYRGKVITDDPGTTESPEQYTVSKLTDNNCWMTKNLNLGRSGTDGSNGNGTITLTSDDTDLADNTTFTLPVGDTSSYTSSTNLAKVRLTNTSGATTNGAYYTWSAAVANTESISAAPTTSICPKNWDLPSNTMYTNLSSKSAYTSSNQTTAQPSNFLINGGFTQGSSFYQTSYSYFWTNTSSSITAAYGARVNGTTMTTSSSTGTTYGGNKYYRKNIRCVASNGAVAINYDGNGTTEYPVTGTVASQTNAEINSTSTSVNGFTRTGWAFNGWNTAANGSGTSIAANTAIANLDLAPGSTITLYAEWTPQRQIIYNDNCSYNNAGCATNTDTTNTSSWTNAGSGITLGSDSYFTTRVGYVITSWNTARDGSGTSYNVLSSYTVPSTLTTPDQVTLYAMWVPRYTIVYNGNNATGGSMVSSGTELKHTNINEGSTINLYAPNYWKTNYGFVGWSPNPTATVGGTDPIYGPNESISAPSYDEYGEEISGTKTITLYAIWLAADSAKTMQTFTASDCQNLSQTTFNPTTGKITAPAGSVIALKDQRDNNVYTVTRLADGKCWMTENLRLEAENTVGNNQYDPSVTNELLSQGYGGVFEGLDSSENANFLDNTAATPNNLYNSTNITGNSPDYRFPRYNNNNTNTSLTASYNDTDSSTYYSWYSYGNYYTWAAAMANTTYYTDSDSEFANTSICPANWSLPTSDTTAKDFGVLSQSYGGTGDNQYGAGAGDIMSNRFRTFPNNFLYSGYFFGSSAGSRGSGGGYWSRSANGNAKSYNLYLYSTSLYPSDFSGNKSDGFSVRCLIDS